MKKTARIALVAAAAALVLSSCGERDDSGSDEPSDTPSTSESASETVAANPDFKACMVSDSNGFDDKSFNQTSLKGMTDAAEQLGIETAQVESTGDEQYADNINQLLQEDCDQITTVGFLLGDTTLEAAKTNADVDFAIVDYAYFNDKGKNIAPANLQGLTYSTDQAAYLAGYLAAAQSESGVVGTFGGLNIPTVTIFMEGFRLGIERYNADNDAEVQLLGWDGTDGSFTEDFVDKTKGQAIGEQMVAQGADILMPVAGSSGLGGLQAVKDAGGFGIWVDTDGFESTEYGDMLLTSVMKGLDVSVTAAIQASVDGAFSNEPYNGTLENGGVGLAPYHDFEGAISDETKAAIEDLKAQIISGELVVGEAG